jgi:hypothetical protein
MNRSSDASSIYRSTASAPYINETASSAQRFEVVDSGAPTARVTTTTCAVPQPVPNAALRDLEVSVGPKAYT